MNRNRVVLLVLAAILAGSAVLLAVKEIFGPGVRSGAVVVMGLVALMLVIGAAKAGPRKPR